MGNEKFSYIIKDDQPWTQEIFQDLKDNYDVIYHGGEFGIRIIKDELGVCFDILNEDDGHLFSTYDSGMNYSIYWLRDLGECVNEAIEYVKSHPEKYGDVEYFIIRK